jgi:hypothetical protein
VTSAEGHSESAALLAVRPITGPLENRLPSGPWHFGPRSPANRRPAGDLAMDGSSAGGDDDTGADALHPSLKEIV